MRPVTPKVQLVAITAPHQMALQQFFSDHQLGDICDFKMDNPAERLIEFAGRLCYMSFAPYDPERPIGTNPNVEKVREDLDKYIGNVLKMGHGSILEHVNVTFIFTNVSRIFTHELVRHRAGMAYSQESMRYVRLQNIPFFIRPSLAKNPEGADLIAKTVDYLEETIQRLYEIYGVEDMKNFTEKKEITSAIRSICPDGIGTKIMATGNLRAIRHEINMRAAPSADEEMRIVFHDVASLMKQKFPNIFQDLTQDPTTGGWVLGYPKV